MIVAAVERAINAKKSFSMDDVCIPAKKCSNFANVLDHLNIIFKTIDNVLFDGILSQFMKDQNIPFQIKETQKGPAGLTVFQPSNGMCVYINSAGWIDSFPAMVGGTLCESSAECIIKIFLHEIVHVILFCIYLELDFSADEIQNLIHSHFDHTHNVLFTFWLRFFFGQFTIDNSLLLTETAKYEPLKFKHSILETEKTCLLNEDNNKKQKHLQLFYQGKWQPVQFLQNHPNIPHHSYVLTSNDQRLLVPNGLLEC